MNNVSRKTLDAIWFCPKCFNIFEKRLPMCCDKCGQGSHPYKEIKTIGELNKVVNEAVLARQDAFKEFELFLDKELEVDNMEKEIEINGEKYVSKSSVKNFDLAKTLKGKKYVIARAKSAGVFAGYLDYRKGQEVVLLNARRIWYWKGAASLSQLAVDGTTKPSECKFPCEVPRVELLQVIELLDVTENARKSIGEVPVWQM